MNGQMPGQMGPMEQRIDFDAMVSSGVISEETSDKIKAYMDEHKPAEGEGAPAEGQAPIDQGVPAEGQQAPMPATRTDGQKLSILDELLLADVITAQEYEAISEAQKENQTVSDGQTPPAMPDQDGQQRMTPPEKPSDDQTTDGQTPPTMPGQSQTADVQ